MLIIFEAKLKLKASILLVSYLTYVQDLASGNRVIPIPRNFTFIETKVTFIENTEIFTKSHSSKIFELLCRILGLKQFSMNVTL